MKKWVLSAAMIYAVCSTGIAIDEQSVSQSGQLPRRCTIFREGIWSMAADREGHLRESSSATRSALPFCTNLPTITGFPRMSWKS